MLFEEWGCRSPSDRLSCRSYSRCFVLERRGWPCNVSFGTVGDGPGFFPGVSMVGYQLKPVSDGSSRGTPRSMVIPGSRRRRLTTHADRAKPMQPAGAMIAIACMNVIMACPFICRVLRCCCAHPTARTFPFTTHEPRLLPINEIRRANFENPRKKRIRHGLAGWPHNAFTTVPQPFAPHLKRFALSGVSSLEI